MRLVTYLDHERNQGFISERAAKCVLDEACKKLGIKKSDTSKLQIMSGIVYIQNGEESVEFGELLSQV